MSNSDLLNLIQAGIISVLAIGIGLPFGRALVQRFVAPKPARPLPPPAENERLERIERAIEAMAVEVERIAEGQRFVTRLMADGNSERAPALPAPR